jgi:putative ABC transport system permease protein
VTGARFVLRLAFREGRASSRRLVTLALAVAVGVAALVAINSFTANLLAEVRQQARSLLGADLGLSSGSAYSPQAERIVASLREAAGGERAALARVTSLAAMAYAPSRTGSRLVQLSAAEPGYPFFGLVETDPAGAWPRLRETGGAIVDPSLLVSLGAAPGDTIRIGEARFPIVATIVHMPGDVAVRAALGPRVFVPGDRLAATGLLAIGSRARYETFVRLPAGAEPRRLADRFRGPLAAERVTIRTVADDQRRLGETLGRLGRYLGLIALMALLLGGLGVASAVHVFVKRKRETVAVLRCLGAAAHHVLAVFVLQVVAAGLVGGVVGAILGVAVQGLLARVLGSFLPVTVPWALSPSAAATGIGFGLWVALAFAAIPLLGTRRLAPLLLLRPSTDGPSSTRRDPAVLAAGVLIALSVALLAILQAGSVQTGLGFAGGIATALLVLWLAALGLARALRRFPPRGLPYLGRQGLANLHRPGNQTVTVVLALGFGTFLLATLIVVQHNLLRDLRAGRGASRSNLVFFDVQTDQRDTLTALLKAHGAPVGEAVPVVPMRIATINGRPVGDTLKAAAVDEERTRGRSALRREYRSSYRGGLAPSERVVEGRFWTASEVRADPAPVSLERGVARELGVRVGDTIDWDVQGVTVRSRVVNLREVEWARFEPNFFAVFAPGSLDDAPQTFVTLTRLDDAASRARLQRAVVEALPNVSTLDIAEVQETIEGILSQVGAAIRFMAAFSLAAGTVVLLGALGASRRERVREGVLLRTLGATRRQVAAVLATEYAALGLLAVTVALGLAVAAGFGLTRGVFHAPFALPWAALAGLGLTVVGLTVGVGLGASGPVYGQTPLEVLRAE